MFQNNNGAVVKHLAKRSLCANKRRSVIAVIAIALTGVLFTTLFTIGVGTAETLQNQTMRQAGTDGHAMLKYITNEQYNKIKEQPSVKKISYRLFVADSVDNPEFSKRNVEMSYMDDAALQMSFCEPTTGQRPQKENEVIADTKTLDLLGIPHEIGAKVSLTYTIKGEKVQKDFALSGWWESDPLIDAGFVVVSKSYVDSNSAKLVNTYKENYSYAGVINSYLLFDNSINISGKLHKVITDSGYDWGNKQASNYIQSNVNWAYNSTGILSGPTSIIAALAALLLIVFTGYLIIYNIFQISVKNDIRFYGMLKTIGTTGKQIRGMIRRQALLLSAVGIPVGLIAGYLIGKLLVPVVISATNADANAGITVSLNPLIFVGSALFVLITVLISTGKPGRIAAGVSPIEAMRFEDGDVSMKKNKKSTDGGKIYRMALSNLGRNKRRTVLSIISMSLSLILLNTMFTLSQGFDMDKYLSRFVDTDFLIGNANYFNELKKFKSTDDQLSESFINAVMAQPGFEEGGRLYYDVDTEHASIDYKNFTPSSDSGGKEATDGHGNTIKLAQDGKPMLGLYGLEDLPLSDMEILEGEKDKSVLMEKLKTGKYIVEGIYADNYGNADMKKLSHYSIGDTITIHVDGKSHTYELLAKAKQNYRTSSNRIWDDFGFYLPASEYLKIVEKPVLMTYAFNVANGKESDMEQFIKTYTEQKEPAMDYESKQTVAGEFNGYRSTVLMVGGVLSFITGLIGIINFINSILASIIARRREFAVLQSVGMTGKQLRRMLRMEGSYYSIGAILLSLLAGTVCSVYIVKSLIGSLWFFSYHFILWPLLAMCPILILIALTIPVASYRSMVQQSIVERLRKAV